MNRTLFVFCVLALGLAGCNSGQAGAASPSGPGGGTVFSSTIDGEKFSSSITTGDMNIAMNQLDDNKQPYLVFMLGDIKSEDDPETTRTFRVVVAKKTGSVHLTQAVDVPNYGMDLDWVVSPFVKYRPKDMQFEVTTLTADRLKGKFSGAMFLTDVATSQGKKEVMVDVSFDIPISPQPAP